MDTIIKRLMENRVNDSILSDLMSYLYNLEGQPLNGGECASVAYSVYQVLDNPEITFSGTIIDSALSHVMLKYKGNYYDATNDSGYADISGCQVVDNLEFREENSSFSAILGMIGNDEYGWIDIWTAQYDKYMRVLKDYLKRD